jgi:hypothetical protein
MKVSAGFTMQGKDMFPTSKASSPPHEGEQNDLVRRRGNGCKAFQLVIPAGETVQDIIGGGKNDRPIPGMLQRK